MRSKVTLKTKAATTTTSTTGKEYKYPNGIIQLGIRLPDGTIEPIKNSSIYLDSLVEKNINKYTPKLIRDVVSTIINIYEEQNFDENEFIELNNYDGIIEKMLSKLVIQLGRHQSKQESNLEEINETDWDY